MVKTATTTKNVKNVSNETLIALVKRELGRKFKDNKRGCVEIDLTQLFADHFAKNDWNKARALATQFLNVSDQLEHKGCTFKFKNGMVLAVKVCTEFKSLNTYLDHVLGIKTLGVFEIYSSCLEGKRDTIFEEDSFDFLAGNKELCRSVLAYLRKTRKSSWLVTRSDADHDTLRDLDNEADYRGEREWRGTYVTTRIIPFKTKGGKAVGQFTIGVEDWGFETEEERRFRKIHRYDW